MKLLFVALKNTPVLTFMTDCDHDALIIHSSTVLHSRTFIYLLPFRKSNYLLSFCTINHFVRVAVTFFPNGGHLIWNETHHCLSPQTGLSFLFSPLLFIFSSSSSSLSTQGPGAGLSACQAARIRHARQGWVSLPLTQPVCRSVFHSVSTLWR